MACADTELDARRKRGEEHGHQGGNNALMTGAILAALVYTPVILIFVWGVRWWIALLATPLGFVVAIPGTILYLCAFQIVRRLVPSQGSS